VEVSVRPKATRAMLAMLASLTCPPFAAFGKTIDQGTAELKLDSKQLVGIWACTGTSLGKPVTATVRWYHLEDHSLWMTLHPTPASGNQTYLEQWTWEDPSDTLGSVDWRTTPDARSFEQASYTSAGYGFAKGKMLWIRHAAQSTQSRTFTLLGHDRLAFYEAFGDPGTPPRVVYKLDCKRTLAEEPQPQ
jgi:hypothetical protein